MAELADIAARAAAAGLTILGGFHAENDETLPAKTQTLLLLGPNDGFWAHFTASYEWAEGAPDPMDRWSRRVIGTMACDLGAKALFPFGGPPYHPFYTWALRTGHIWQSPIKLLVHDSQGLMVSFRGALALKHHIELPAPAIRPCDTCAAPCTTTCPALGLQETSKDLRLAHRFMQRLDLEVRHNRVSQSAVFDALIRYHYGVPLPDLIVYARSHTRTCAFGLLCCD
jgi:hypothetical protein